MQYSRVSILDENFAQLETPFLMESNIPAA
jgi:hypothetical protein